MIADCLEAADKKICRLLAEGGVILVPTDTVWGLACDFQNVSALTRMYRLKKSEIRQTALLCSGVEQLETVNVSLHGTALKLARKFWPGALTIVVFADSPKLKWVAASDKTIGLRVPDNDRLRNLINRYGNPIAATSANFTGEKPPRLFVDVPQAIVDGVDAVIDQESAAGGVASTVIRIVDDDWQILRPGAIKEGDVRQVLKGYEG